MQQTAMWEYRRAAYQENMLGAYVVEERGGSENAADRREPGPALLKFVPTPVFLSNVL